MKKSDFLANEFEKIIRVFDEDGELSERDYKKLSRLFSAVVRTSPEIRDVFFNQVREVSVKMKKNFDEMNRSLMEQLLGSEKKEKILN